MSISLKNELCLQKADRSIDSYLSSAVVSSLPAEETDRKETSETPHRISKGSQGLFYLISGNADNFTIPNAYNNDNNRNGE